jgi:hypothetical protein
MANIVDFKEYFSMSKNFAARLKKPDRRKNSLRKATGFAHYLWIRLLAMSITTRQVIDFNKKYFFAQKLSKQKMMVARLAPALAPRSAQALFAHFLWIRLLARLLRPVNPIDFKEYFFHA